MQPDQLILPAIATAALGTALFVPLRDDRPGKRATLTGRRIALRPSLFKTAAYSPEETHAERSGDPAGDSNAAQIATAKPDSSFASIAKRIRSFFTEPVPATSPSEREPLVVARVTAERSFAEELGALLALSPSSPIEAPAPDAATERLQAVVPRDAAGPHVPSMHVVAARCVKPERVVPITRMPLRPQHSTVTWTAFAPEGSPVASRTERHAYLARLASERCDGHERLMVCAYHEEDPAGRMLALRAIRRAEIPNRADVFIDALAVGTDDERSFAVDALIGMDRADAVTPAFRDRVDAIAAQAALGFVWSHARADFYSALAPFVDRARIDTILALLAGIVE